MRWFPVQPSWIVAIGLVVLAAMPHQMGPRVVGLLTSHVGLLIGIGLVWWLLMAAHPVLAVSVAMLLFAVNIIPGAVYERFTGTKEYFTGAKERFTGPASRERFTESASRERFTPTINRDVVKPQRQWFQEEVMSEDPHVIQERTENPAILYDRVEEHEKWEDEQALGQTPLAIQERPVPEFDDNYSPYR